MCVDPLFIVLDGKIVSIYALVPLGVTPVLAKVQPEVNVPVKLDDFKFCAHAAALAPKLWSEHSSALHQNN